jgi:hypothetical protein
MTGPKQEDDRTKQDYNGPKDDKTGAQTAIRKITTLLNRGILRLQSSRVFWPTGADVSAESHAPTFKEQTTTAASHKGYSCFNKCSENIAVGVGSGGKWFTNRTLIASTHSPPPPAHCLHLSAHFFYLQSGGNSFLQKLTAYVPD